MVVDQVHVHGLAALEAEHQGRQRVHGSILRCGNMCGARCSVAGTREPAPPPTVRAELSYAAGAHAFVL